MKKTRLIIGALFAACLFSCNTGTPQNTVYVAPAPQQQYATQTPQQVTVQPAANIPGGFNVQAFAGLLKQTANPDVLTQAINAPDNNINHLDLDGDGAVDYLRVNQTGDNSLVVVDETSSTQRVDICTLTVNNVNNSYSVVGVPDYCGSSYSYYSPSGLTLSDYVFLSWWFAPSHYRRAYYHPGWGYHTHYYRGYSAYRPRTGLYTSNNVSTYRKTTTTTTTTTRTGGGTSVTAGKQTQQVQQPVQQRNIPTVSNATTSQKQFQANEGNRYKANNAGAPNAFATKTNTVRATAPPAPVRATAPPAPVRATTTPTRNTGGGFGGRTSGGGGFGGRTSGGRGGRR